MYLPKVEYNVRIDLHEIRDLKLFDGTSEVTPNPYIEVNVCNQIQTTPKKTGVSSALIQSSYNFSVSLTAIDFECTSIQINAYHSYILSSALIGSQTLSLNYVYQKPQHWIYRNWVPLISPSRPSEISGYILITVGVFAPADIIPAVDESTVVSRTENNDQSARISSSPEINLSQYNLSVCIYKGQDIAPVIGMYNLIEPFVRVIHGTSSESTKCITNEPNPSWKSLISFPAYNPCFDSNVIIELWNGQSKPVLMGKFRIDLFLLLKEPFPLTWVNFYWTQPPYGVAANLFSSYDASTTSLLPTSYAGRMLISASSQRVQNCSVKSLNITPLVNEPPMTKYLVWVDLYELTSQNECKENIIVEFSIGSTNILSKSIPLYDDIFIFNSHTGRLDETYFYLSDGQNPWDLFIYIQVGNEEGIWTASKFSRESFKRLNLNALPSQIPSTPKWYTLTPIYNIVNGYTFNLLADIVILPAITAEERPERLEYYLKEYYFRSFIYEGINLRGVGGYLPNPYVKISIGDQIIQTRPIQQTYVPQWYEAYEIKISLPKNLNLASELKVEIYSKTSSYLSPDDQIGFTYIKLTGIPKVWRDPPKWIDLSISDVQRLDGDTNSKLLCSFELVEKEEVDAFPFYDDIRPSTIPADIRLFIIGIRLFESIINPFISISYGREVESSNIPLWHDNTSKPVSGSDGNWNFMTDFAITVELPKRSPFQSYFEINIRGTSSKYIAGSDSSIGFSTLYFNSFIPWFDNETRIQNSKFFQNTFTDQMNQNDNLPKATNINVDQSELEQKKYTYKHQNSNFENVNLCDHEVGNSMLYKPVDLLCNEMKNKVSTTDKDHELFVKLDSILAEDDKANLAARLKKIGTIRGFDAALLNFDLNVFTEFDQETDQKFEIMYELEQDLDLKELPYEILPIFKLNDKGLYTIIGFLKYIICITPQEPKDDAVSIAEEQIKSFLNLRKWVSDQYVQVKPIVCRCYILSARGLLPPSGDLNPSVYIFIRSQQNDTDKKKSVFPSSIRDISFIRKQGYRPEFNQVYEIGCTLPNNALLSVSIIGTGTVSEEIIGTTIIDIENRWFHPKVKSMTSTNSIPIELRTLRLENSLVSHGTLRGWYEVLSEQKAKSIPITPLASPDPEAFQLRVVIWRVRHVPLEDNSSISIFVSGIYTMEDNSIDTQSTETHYNSRDGNGNFNWRMVFNIKIPTIYPILKLQLWSYGLIKSDCIGECIIDLSNDFGRAHKNSSQILRIQKTWYGFTHPIHKEIEQGQVELEASIVPSKIADVNPVGKGRENPNTDPFLEDITENRTYVDWKGIGETITSATDSIWKTAKRGFIIGAVIGVIALIIFLIVILKR